MKVISAVVMDNPLATPISVPSPTIEDKLDKVIPPTTVTKPTIKAPKPVTLKQKIDLQQKTIAIKEKRKKQLAEQQIEKQLLADLKNQTVLQKKAKQKSIEAAFAKELKEQTAKTLQHQIRQEQERIAGAKVQGEVNKYKALILQAISQKWLVPVGVDKKLYTDLLIRVAPGGAVLDVQITKSSGNVALDRSARDAVFKASPLPVPNNEDGFDQFRQFALRVKPENVMVGNVE